MMAMMTTMMMIMMMMTTTTYLKGFWGVKWTISPLVVWVK
jgi:hypothetical protein